MSLYKVKAKNTDIITMVKAKDMAITIKAKDLAYVLKDIPRTRPRTNTTAYICLIETSDARYIGSMLLIFRLALH